MLALRPEKSSKKEHPNLYNSITKRHKSANTLTTTALIILYRCVKQRPGVSNTL